MKTHSLTYLGGLAAVIAVGAWTATSSELEWDNIVEAADGVQTVSVQCQAATLSAYVPSAQYTFTFPAAAGTVFSPNKITVTSTLNGTGINGDASPTITKGEDVAGTLTIRHQAPLSKLGGMQCQTNSSYSKLDVRGVNASSNLDIAAEGAADTTWNGSNQIDSAAKTLFGFGGLIGTSHVLDGQDDDSSQNGEIVFGGNASSARYALFSLVKYMGTSMVNNSEDLTYTFTPMAAAQ